MTTAGIFTAIGAQHPTFLSLRNEAFSIQSGGLYACASVSGAARAIGQDWVTLLVEVGYGRGDLTVSGTHLRHLRR